MHDHPHPHSHDHHHGHDHPHEHHRHHDPTETRSQHVVLDLGDDVGALIVQVDPELLGVEVEISPARADGCRQHKEVLARAAGEATVYALVYDNLPEGDYTVWLDDAEPARGVHVGGGAIAQFDLRRA